ncbi:recombinase, partial [Bacillus toyonensis]
VEAMQRVGMKSNTFYRRVKEYEFSLEKSKLP